MFNKSIKSFGICFAIFFVLFFSIRLFAEEMGFTELGVFKKWAAYKVNDTESCLIQADPSKATGKYKKQVSSFETVRYIMTFYPNLSLINIWPRASGSSTQLLDAINLYKFSIDKFDATFWM